MKKLIFIIILFSISAFAQENDSKIEKYEQEIKAYSKLGNYEKALEVSEKLLNRTIKKYGFENKKTAEIYSIIGSVYEEKGIFDIAITNYQKAIEIYEKIPNLNTEIVLVTHRKLLFLQEVGQFENEAEKTYQKVLQLSQKEKPKNVKEQVIFNNEIATLFAYRKRYDISDKYFLKSYSLIMADSELKKDYKERENISDLRQCSQSYDFSDGFDKREELFKANLAKLFGIQERHITPNIVNGKAIYLHKPKFPASQKGISKRVPVKLVIDEEGNVISADAFCGKGKLEEVSEDAAKQSKFSPTLLSGKAVKVSGIIIYIFK